MTPAVCGRGAGGISCPAAAYTVRLPFAVSPPRRPCTLPPPSASNCSPRSRACGAMRARWCSTPAPPTTWCRRRWSARSRTGTSSTSGATSWSGWLSIAHNAHVDERRRSARMSLVEPADDEAPPHAHLDRWAQRPGRRCRPAHRPGRRAAEPAGRAARGAAAGRRRAVQLRRVRRGAGDPARHRDVARLARARRAARAARRARIPSAGAPTLRRVI